MSKQDMNWELCCGYPVVIETILRVASAWKRDRTNDIQEIEDKGCKKKGIVGNGK
jgi:hypothetical protein